MNDETIISAWLHLQERYSSAPAIVEVARHIGVSRTTVVKRMTSMRARGGWPAECWVRHRGQKRWP